MNRLAVAMMLVVCGCGESGRDAKGACEQLTKEGFGTNCVEDKPGGLGSAAWQAYAFDIAEPKGKTCQGTLV